MTLAAFDRAENIVLQSDWFTVSQKSCQESRRQGLTCSIGLTDGRRQ